MWDSGADALAFTPASARNPAGHEPGSGSSVPSMAQIFYPGRPPIDTDDEDAVLLMAHVRRAATSGEHVWHDLAGSDGDSIGLFIGPNIPISVTVKTDSLPAQGLASIDLPEPAPRPASPVDAYYEAGRRGEL
jgi:hypothetical protein